MEEVVQEDVVAVEEEEAEVVVALQGVLEGGFAFRNKYNGIHCCQDFP